MSNPIATATVATRKNAYGEWVVRARGADGKRIPEADYFTDDLTDAQQTAVMMVGGKVGHETKALVRMGAKPDSRGLYPRG